MWISVFLISSILHITAGNEGCTLSGTNHLLQEITAFTGQSVLLPCSCTVRQFDTPRLTWTKLTLSQEPVILTQSDLYIDRVKLFNRKCPGNLSVLLSHLTQDDQGDYRCTIEDRENWDIARDIRLYVKGCSLSDSNQLEIVRSPGQSVLLPCSCNELQAKPHGLTWTKLPAIPLTKSDLYRDRVAMFNTESSPGNLSVLLSFITKEDQGWYRCTINNQDTRDIHITVKETDGKKHHHQRPETTKALPTTASNGTDTVRTSGEAPSASSLQNNTIQYVLMAVLPVILIIAGMALYIYKRNKRKNTTGDNSSGSKTGGENNDEDDSTAMYSTVADRNTGLGNNTTALGAPDDPNAMHATVQHRNANQEDTTTPLSAPDDPSVIYCTIVHMTGKGKAAVSLESSGEIEYASIKTGRSS
ncbi:polymeric immunoglobulin receptor-like isoform X1 [Salvelinus alpinus]|uniref:polymeric immunoglobulin receptor-like isoform X1 n=1 Tax=Salvelinus alpinus TaxID=8036 RepID=UPI0039FCD2B9